MARKLERTLHLFWEGQGTATLQLPRPRMHIYPRPRAAAVGVNSHKISCTAGCSGDIVQGCVDCRSAAIRVGSPHPARVLRSPVRWARTTLSLNLFPEGTRSDFQQAAAALQGPDAYIHRQTPRPHARLHRSHHTSS